MNKIEIVVRNYYDYLVSCVHYYDNSFGFLCFVNCQPILMISSTLRSDRKFPEKFYCYWS